MSQFHSIERAGSDIFRPFHRLSSTNEARLVQRSANILTRLDPLMSRSHAVRIRETLAVEYAAMAAESPELLNLPGSTDIAINHLTGLSIHNGHYFAYIPETAPAEKLGLFVFLHGNAGNFRLMIWCAGRSSSRCPVSSSCRNAPSKSPI